MTPIERQILKNQLAIMNSLSMKAYVYPEVTKTEQLLSPKGAEEDCCDMEDNSFMQVGEDCKLCGTKDICMEMLSYHRLGKCVKRGKNEKRI